jgi:hypothetical protein
MKYLQTFSLFESRTPGTLSKRQEAFLNRYTKGTWSVNPATGLVDVQGTFDCWDDCHHDRWNPRVRSLRWIKFGTVTGDFHCPDNEFTTLAGAPRTVEGNFDFSENYLTSLQGAPQTVGGNFLCSSNELTTLSGAPQTVKGSFYCDYNKLTSLEGAPLTVKGSFRCNAFELKPGKWNLAGWEQVLHTGSLEARKLISTLPYLQPDWWNSELSRDPARTIQLLAPVWSQMSGELKREIRIPPGYEDRLGMRSELSDLGLF